MGSRITATPKNANAYLVEWSHAPLKSSTTLAGNRSRAADYGSMSWKALLETVHWLTVSLDP